MDRRNFIGGFLGGSLGVICKHRGSPSPVGLVQLRDYDDFHGELDLPQGFFDKLKHNNLRIDNKTGETVTEFEMCVRDIAEMLREIREEWEKWHKMGQ